MSVFKKSQYDENLLIFIFFPLWRLLPEFLDHFFDKISPKIIDVHNPTIHRWASNNLNLCTWILIATQGY
jgi:hypothetical protein